MSRENNFQKIVSSNLHSAAYDPAAKVLTVRFTNGTQYRYPEFPETLWKDFARLFPGKLGSAGSYFSKQIRFLPNEKIEDWQ